MKLKVQDTMLAYACNQKGCCCKGWGIPFEGEDVGRLLSAFPAEDREGILEGAQVDIDPDGTLRHIRLRGVGEEGACQFLAGDGRCGVHATVGPEPLPHLCRSFPAFSCDLMGEREVYFDAICPEVLNRIADGEGAIQVVEVDTAPGDDLFVRGQRPKEMPSLRFGPHLLTPAGLAHLRGLLLDAFAQGRGTALSTLGHVNHALLRLARGDVSLESLTLDWDEDVADFEAFFDTCVPIHDPRLLARFVVDYRRFIHRIDLDWSDARALEGHLRADPAWRDALDPHRADLQPLLFRYLSHRVFSAFDRSPSAGRLEFGYGTLNHCLAAAFRIALGLSRWQGRPVDADLMLVAIGAAEYVFRVFRVPQYSMPWFGVDRVEMQIVDAE